ncbi:MAG TPA: hypothetical protein PLK30_26495 [Blastocatellia bacterium]|nr:hypothetical protein [Blastocatellia bacterium]
MVGREDFLLKDYELKARYLTDHFSRMWVRFNFFLTIESGLVGLSFHKDYATHIRALSYLGGFLALVWFHFGRTDNYLVDFYRNQVGAAFNLLSSLIEEKDQQPRLLFVGNVQPDDSVSKTLLRGRWGKLSATELAVFLPLVYLGIWILRLLSTHISFPRWI